MTDGTPRPENVRDRFRSQVIDEAKRVALRQLAEGGPTAVSVNAIAKQLGMSGPALYRYFDSRVALMTELVTDAYRDLTASLLAATEQQRSTSAVALATAYRRWAIEQPHRYRLLFAAPLIGYDAHTAELVNEAQAAMNVLLDVLSTRPAPELPSVPSQLAKAIAVWTTSQGVPAIPPAVALHAIHIWTRMHGHVRLEIDGTFESMGLDPRLIFETSLPEIYTAHQTRRTAKRRSRH
jgi:AcrR family transcriptional regulator